MKTVRISDDVWEGIAAKGKFGETVDDVLRRDTWLDIPKKAKLGKQMRQRHAVNTMHARIKGNTLIVEFEDGGSRQWPLPEKTNKVEIRRVRHEAIEFADNHEATLGQRNAIIKTTTDAGYHTTK